MQIIEISVPTPWGRGFTFKITVKHAAMAKDKMVRVLIIDAYGIGYVAGKEYDVAQEEAVKLIEAKKAVPLAGPDEAETMEKAVPKHQKTEKRGGKG